MEQLDVFDLEDLKKPLPSDDELVTIATNRLLLTLVRNSDNEALVVQFDRNAIQAANTILKKAGGMINRINITSDKTDLSTLTDAELEQIAKGG